MIDDYVACHSPFCKRHIHKDMARYGKDGRPYCSEDCNTLATEIDEKNKRIKDLLKKIPVQTQSGFRIC